MADPACDELRHKIAGVETRIVELAEREAEMQRTLEAFQLAQFRALGQSLADCLRLRHELARRRAEISRNDDDIAAARSAADDERSYRDTVDGGEAPPELDESTADELKRLYRSAAMRCHPDRVGEADKAAAQERFVRVQKAFRDRDVAALRLLLREIDAMPGEAPDAAATNDRATLEAVLSALRARAADLILAIQTRQIEPDYRRALDRGGWGDYFDEARRGFELECAELQRQLDELAHAETA